MRRFITGVALVAGIMALTPQLSLAAEAPSKVSAAAPSKATPAKIALVKRMFAAMRIDVTMSNMMRQMAPAMLQQMRTRYPQVTDAQIQAASDVVVGVADKYFPRMLDAMMEVYAEEFTEEELTKVLAFYESPTGKAMMAKLPALTAKTVPIATQFMPEMQAEMEAKMCDVFSCKAEPQG